jgi:hypothetical protein
MGAFGVFGILWVMPNLVALVREFYAGHLDILRNHNSHELR